MRTVYQIENEPIAFFSAVFDAYKVKDAFITSENRLQVLLGDEFVKVTPSEEKAGRVAKKLKEVDFRAFREIDAVLRSNAQDKEQVAFEYIKLVFRYGKTAREKIHLAPVRKTLDTASRVFGEVHRLHGFLRFQELKNGALYAPFDSDNDILELLLPHFISRYKNSAFVLHDVKRKTAIIYDGKDWILVPAETAEIRLSECEETVQALWKKYYKTVAIPMRKNTRQMKNYMPVRYWKFILEKDEDLP